MSETVKGIGPGSPMSFYDKAAWYGFITPLVTVAIDFGILKLAEHFSPSRMPTADFTATVVGCSLCIHIISLALGLISYYGSQYHRRKSTIWAAWLAILASIALGGLTFIALAFSAIGHGC